MRAAADIYTDFSKLGELKRMATRDQDSALKEAAKQFEALFVQMLLQQMRQASFGDPIFASDQLKFYREMHDQQLALHLAERGSLGLADMLVAHLSERSAKPDSDQSLTHYRKTAKPSEASPLTRAAQSFPLGEGNTQETSLKRAQPAEEIPGRFESAEEFVRTLWPEAQRAAAKLGLDPKLLLAQAALETGWGKRIIHRPDGRSSYNLFNLKAAPSWRGEEVQVNTLEYQEGVAVKKRAAFRAYENYRQSFEDYLNLIQSPRYAEALSSAEDPHQYLTALKRAGYATDPDYADKVLAIYRRETLAAL
ncbi:MAG: flagellar assembly peptidoglycan hydrolase FlgJ [Methylohalobius sp.]